MSFHGRNGGIKYLFAHTEEANDSLAWRLTELPKEWVPGCST